MNKPIYNDDVERLVNPRTAAARKRSKQMDQRRQARLLRVIVACLALILIFLVLRLFDVIGIAFFIAATLSFACVASFSAGRLERVK